MAAKLALLWHMHQPNYFDPAAGSYRMPWVFLHAAKDYYEMLRLAEEEGARVTFNLVPSLMDQLADYARHDVPDLFLERLRKDPRELAEAERDALATQLAMVHPVNQAGRYPRLAAILKKFAGESGCAAISRQEWLDAEVLYLLAWTGEVTREEDPFLVSLAARGQGFSQEEKLAFLHKLHDLCGRTPAALRAAGEGGRVELSATPYYHPIIPLLIDPSSGREAVAEIRLPVLEHGFDDDAAWHVRNALTRHEEVFGKKPNGFWPSEGSVSTAAAALLAAEGLSWAASDEDILAASLGHPLSGAARKDLYRPYLFRDGDGRGLRLFFRDKGLSDLIGFTYASWDPRDAAADFVEKLRQIVRTHGPDSVICVILDGENAWEHYRENAAPFLRELYRGVRESGDVEFATFSELAAPTRELTRIHAGSWIYGSFTTWVGHPEKNRAWELLDRTRTRFLKARGGMDEASLAAAWKHLHVAEGSDWFWWLGDDHYTPLAGEFDELFRLQLAQVHRLMGEEPPMELRTPIKRVGRRGLLREPRDRFRPTLDGKFSSFFEWHDAGLFDLGYDAGSMHRAERLLSRLWYGVDGEFLHLCLEGSQSLDALPGLGYRIEIAQGTACTPCATLPDDEAGLLRSWGEVLELSLPLAGLEVDATGRVSLAFRLMRNGSFVERAPQFHMAELPLGLAPSPGMWSV